MTQPFIQTSFISGEISPDIYGRTDLAKYKNGAATMRNFFVNYRGGAFSRAGLKYVGTCLQDGSGPPPRDINFQFNINQGYALEFGDQSLTRAVSGAVTAGGLIKLTITSTNGMLTDDVMVVSGVVGTTEANGTWNITVVDSTHVTLQGSTFSNVYVSGGSTVTEAGYMRIKYRGAYVVETGKVITGASNANPGVIAAVGHGFVVGEWVYIASIGGMTQLNGLTWIVATVPSADTFTLTDLFGNTVNTLSYGVYTSGGTASRIYTVASPYLVEDVPFIKYTQNKDVMTLTCRNQDTGTEYPPYDLTRSGNTSWAFSKESFASTISAPANTAATATNSTTKVMTYSYVVTAVNTAGEESIASTAASVSNNDIAVNAGSNSITWDSVSGAVTYNIYKATPVYVGTSTVTQPAGVAYGYIGYSFGGNFVDTNITADFTRTPPIHEDPFAKGAITAVTPTAPGSNYTQAGIGYTITTSTGSGFSGTPIVNAGGFVAFVVENGGSGYAGTDTIAITGGSISATGTYTFTTNPVDGNTIVLNGVTWTFKTTAPVGAQTFIGANLANTLASLVGDLNASANASINVATYSTNGTVLTITYKTPGTGGNAYTLAAGTYGGTVSGAHLTGGLATGGATATLTVGAATGTYPSVVCYFQQRRGYANTLNQPDTYFFSRPGAFLNMDASNPTIDSDAITGAPWAQQINGIQAMQPMTQGLMMLTGNGAWFLTGGNNAALTPADQNATSQAYNGCHTHVGPLVINYDILYVQAKGSIIRDLYYNFFQNVWSGTDITVLSNHLFNYHQIQQWAYCEEPFKIVWAIRDDGILLSLTYLKEQDVYAWARHDTNGLFVNTCSVTEPPVDAAYFIVQRMINGVWKYYAERMDNRNWENVEDCFCVDAGLAYPMTFPATVLTPAAADGTSNISSVLIIAGGSGYTAPTAEAVDETGVGTGATFSVTLSGGAITAITPLTQGTLYTSGKTSIVIADSTGSGAIAQAVITNIVAFTTADSTFSVGNVGDVIRYGNPNASVKTTSDGVTNNGGGKAVITSYVSATEVQANIIEPITAIIPNDPDDTPVPAISGQWSLSTPTTTVSGLNHVEGMEVAILADGGVVENQTVVNGQVTLDNAASAIVVGLPYTCQLQTLYLDLPDKEGTAQGKRKDIYSATIRMDGSRGMSVGTNQPDQAAQPNNAPVVWTDMKQIKDRNASVDAGSAVPLFTGDKYINVPGAWNTAGQVAVQQTFPLPANVLSIVCNSQIGDTSG